MKNFFLILGILSVVASLTMYYVGNSNSALTELRDLFFIPLPLALISFIIVFTKSKSKTN